MSNQIEIEIIQPPALKVVFPPRAIQIELVALPPKAPIPGELGASLDFSLAANSQYLVLFADD